MSEDNVAIVRQMFEALAEDPDRALDQFDEEVVWTPPQDEPESGTVRGKDAFARFLTTWFSSFDDFRSEPLEFIEAGELVVVPQRISGRMRGSGAAVSIDETHVFRLANQKIVEVHGYRTTEEALEAGGPPG